MPPRKCADHHPHQQILKVISTVSTLQTGEDVSSSFFHYLSTQQTLKNESSLAIQPSLQAASGPLPLLRCGTVGSCWANQGPTSKRSRPRGSSPGGSPNESYRCSPSELTGKVGQVVGLRQAGKLPMKLSKIRIFRWMVASSCDQPKCEACQKILH